MDNSIVGATLLLAAGIFIGLVIGVTISPTHHSDSTGAQPGGGSPAGTMDPKAK